MFSNLISIFNISKLYFEVSPYPTIFIQISHKQPRISNWKDYPWKQGSTDQNRLVQGQAVRSGLRTRPDQDQTKIGKYWSGSNQGWKNPGPIGSGVWIPLVKLIVQTKAILFLKSMSEKVGSDIERLWIWICNRFWVDLDIHHSI